MYIYVNQALNVLVLKTLVVSVTKTFAFVNLKTLNKEDRDVAISFLLAVGTSVTEYDALRGNMFS